MPHGLIVGAIYSCLLIASHNCHDQVNGAFCTRIAVAADLFVCLPLVGVVAVVVVVVVSVLAVVLQ